MQGIYKIKETFSVLYSLRISLQILNDFDFGTGNVNIMCVIIFLNRNFHTKVFKFQIANQRIEKINILTNLYHLMK